MGQKVLLTGDLVGEKDGMYVCEFRCRAKGAIRVMIGVGSESVRLFGPEKPVERETEPEPEAGWPTDAEIGSMDLPKLRYTADRLGIGGTMGSNAKTLRARIAQARESAKA